ncbi:MAG: site-2 protease family protein [Terracidiphilus sp.]|jgi:Zn-dependent protease
MHQFLVPFRIDSGGWLVAALCVLFEIAIRGFKFGLAAGSVLVASLLLHEVGHMVTAMSLGVPVREFGLCLYGAYTRRAPSGSQWKETLIAFAGPSVNLLLAFPCLLLHRIGIQLAFCNLTLFVVNLAPLPSSDGLRIVHSIWGTGRHDAKPSVVKHPDSTL